METKKVNNSNAPRRKGGRNPFGKLAIGAGSLVAGAALAETIHRYREDHAPAEENEANTTAPDTADKLDAEEAAAQQVATAQPATPVQPQPTTPPATPNAPTPVDPNEHPTNTNTGGGHTGSNNIAGNNPATPSEPGAEPPSQFDPVEGDADDILIVGESRTIYDANGNEMQVFDVHLNDPSLSGYPFVLADTDGDGFFDTLLEADGSTVADVQIVGGGSLNDYIAQAHITGGDLEDMRDDTGGYLPPTDEPIVAGNIDPNDEHLTATPQGEEPLIAQNERHDTTDPTDDPADPGEETLMEPLGPGSEPPTGPFEQEEVVDPSYPNLPEDEEEARALLAQLLNEDDDDDKTVKGNTPKDDTDPLEDDTLDDDDDLLLADNIDEEEDTGDAVEDITC